MDKKVAVSAIICGQEEIEQGRINNHKLKSKKKTIKYQYLQKIH